jgi:uncharacterized protein YjbJ (UPF0337 family)
MHAHRFIYLQLTIREGDSKNMAKNILKGKWKQLKGTIKDQWGKLTNDEIDQVEGNTEKLIGLVQEKYGYTKEKAEAEVAEFLNQNQ